MFQNLIFQAISLLCIVTFLVNSASASPHSFAGHQISSSSIEAVQKELLNPSPSPSTFMSTQDLGKLTTQERIASFGYPVEMHEVTTSDGYILTMHRIPFGKKFGSQKRKPVLFKHGGLLDSFSWLFNYPDKNFALRLADEGYDVWLANTRGTIYSRRHKNFTGRDKNFFEFSLDEVAKYDIPAEIDYILDTTGEMKLIVLGISLGPLELHMTLSLYPEYNQKISLITSLVPTVYMSNTHTRTQFGAKLARYGGSSIKMILDFISGQTGEYPPPWLTTTIRKDIWKYFERCKNSVISRFICSQVDYNLLGEDMGPDKLTIIHLTASHLLAPISTKLADHFLQLKIRDKLQHYDYGTIENIKVYGTTEPPLYHLKDSTAPVAIFYVENDHDVSPPDIFKMVSELPNVVLVHPINSKKWNHVDILFAQDVNDLFTNHLVDLLEKY